MDFLNAIPWDQIVIQTVNGIRHRDDSWR